MPRHFRILPHAGAGLQRVLVIVFAALLTLPASAVADDEIEFANLSADTLIVYARANRAIQDLDVYLRATGYENPAFIGMNYFGVSVGGIDAIRDLQENRGVDPETFAALYAGFAVPAVAKHLNLKKTTNANGRLELKIDALDGRLRYKGAVVRLYSPEDLRLLFERRDAFRTESERVRRRVFSDYVFSRRRAVGGLGSGGQLTEVDDLDERYTRLQPLLIELEESLRRDASASSVIAGLSSHHYFSLSVGGLDVVSDLQNRKAVDPETFGAIYAGKIAPDYVEDFKITADNRILYQDAQVKMYSPKTLESCFKHRETLELQIAK